MRKKIVAGNWKMNKSLSEGLDLLKGIIEKINDEDISAEVIIAPPYTHLYSFANLLKEKNCDKIKIAAQNCHNKPSGAYTGEISVDMIKDLGVNYTIIGHSERRKYNNESNQLLKEKVDIAFADEINVIFCCGESLEERKDGIHFEIIKKQLEDSILGQASLFPNIIIAYEPVWAIGTGETASKEQAQEMHAFIRQLLKEKFGNGIAENTSILYGGSCNAKNAEELFSMPDVDGGLIGGAALKVDDFVTIIKAR